MLFIAFLCLFDIDCWFVCPTSLVPRGASLVTQILCTRPNRRMETRRATEDGRARYWLFTSLIDNLFVSSFLFCIVGHPDHLQPDRRMEARLKMSDLRSWYWLFVCFPVWHWLFAFFCIWYWIFVCFCVRYWLFVCFCAVNICVCVFVCLTSARNHMQSCQTARGMEVRRETEDEAQNCPRLLLLLQICSNLYLQCPSHADAHILQLLCKEIEEIARSLHSSTVHTHV